MKNYNKPVMETELFLSSENITSLGEWLEESGNEYKEAGITTYVIES